METILAIQKFKDFIEKDYLNDVLSHSRRGKFYIDIDFRKLCEFDYELAEYLLDNPEEAISCSEFAVKEIDMPVPTKIFNCMFKHLPQIQEIPIWELNIPQLNKFIKVRGNIVKIGQVLLQLTTSKFECPNCKCVIGVLQLTNIFKQPSQCGCGRKGKFRHLKDKDELISYQKIVIEEDIEVYKDQDNPKQKMILLKGVLTNKEVNRLIRVSQKVIVNGVLKRIEVKEGSTEFDTYIEANYLEFIKKSWDDIKINLKEEQQIIEMSKDSNILSNMGQSICPSIEGNQQEKECLFLSLIGGKKVYDDSNVIVESDRLHILMVSSPGAGKTWMAKRAMSFSPIHIYSSGTRASAAGIAGTVMKDKDLGCYVLIAGSLPRANQGINVIDELDKIDPMEIKRLNNGLEEGKVPITMAGIQSTLEADTTVIATANPKYGVFSLSEEIEDQINIPKDTLDRFDFVLPILHSENSEHNKRVANMIIARHKKTINGISPIYDREIVIKYIAYARQKIMPELTDEAGEYIFNQSQELTKLGKTNFSNRLIPRLIKISYACAKVRLSQQVLVQDAEEAVKKLRYSYQQRGLITQTGQISEEKMGLKMSDSKINKYQQYKTLLKTHCRESHDIEALKSLAQSQGIDISDFDDMLEKFSRNGDIFHPNHWTVKWNGG